MALVPTYSSLFTKDKVPSILRSADLKGRGVPGDYVGILKAYKILCSQQYRRHDMIIFQNKAKIAQLISIESRSVHLSRVENPTSASRKALHMDKRSVAVNASGIQNQLEALETYFGKLQNEPDHEKQKRSSSRDSDVKTSPEKNELVEPSSLFPAAEKELVSLQNYLSKLNAIQSQGNSLSKKTTGRPYLVNEDYEGSEALNLKPINQDAHAYPENFQAMQSLEDSSDLSLICLLASINIAVFLFEIASPVKNSDLELLTLPSLYGAKINQLILDGEWWRLVTPMFLHCGIFHVALGLWVLLTFGPQVCKVYGSSTFFLIYVLGGISGNLTSFIHTAEPTVGGTGPVFAIIGAWLVYQTQNKEVIKKDVAESLFRKAITATVLSFLLSSFGPIDDWAHVGAMCSGIAYGFITCPTLQLDDSASSFKTDQGDGFALIRKYSDPLKSILIFVIFILILSTLLIFVEPK